MAAIGVGHGAFTGDVEREKLAIQRMAAMAGAANASANTDVARYNAETSRANSVRAAEHQAKSDETARMSVESTSRHQKAMEEISKEEAANRKQYYDDITAYRKEQNNLREETLHSQMASNLGIYNGLSNIAEKGRARRAMAAQTQDAALASMLCLSHKNGGTLPDDVLPALNQMLGSNIVSAGFSNDQSGEFRITMADSKGNPMKPLVLGTNQQLAAYQRSGLGTEYAQPLYDQLSSKFMPEQLAAFGIYDPKNWNAMRNMNYGSSSGTRSGLTFEQQKELIEARKNAPRFDDKRLAAIERRIDNIMYRINEEKTATGKDALGKELKKWEGVRDSMLLEGYQEGVEAPSPDKAGGSRQGTLGEDAMAAIEEAKKKGARTGAITRVGDEAKKGSAPKQSPSRAVDDDRSDVTYDERMKAAYPYGVMPSMAKADSDKQDDSAKTEELEVPQHKYTQPWSKLKQHEKLPALVHKGVRTIDRTGEKIASNVKDGIGHMLEKLGESETEKNRLHTQAVNDARRLGNMTDDQIREEKERELTDSDLADAVKIDGTPSTARMRSDIEAERRIKDRSIEEDRRREANEDLIGDRRLESHRVSDTYDTVLSDEEEKAYSEWKKKLPSNLQYEGDYDLRGYWVKYGDRALPSKSRDGMVHLTDEFKKPNHETFSNESRYANGEWSNNAMYAGRWNEKGTYIRPKKDYREDHGERVDALLREQDARHAMERKRLEESRSQKNAQKSANKSTQKRNELLELYSKGDIDGIRKRMRDDEEIQAILADLVE